MRLVVDANILYSVALNTNGAVADVFFNTRPPLEMCAPKLLRKELDRHRPKMAKYMGLPVARVTEVVQLLMHRVELIDPAVIGDLAWVQAKQLTKGVDPNDEDYVALAIHLGCPLWTGDLKLYRALQGGIVPVLTTAVVRQQGR